MFDGEFVKQLAALTEKRSAPGMVNLPPRAGNTCKLWNPARGVYEDVRLSDVPRTITCADAETLVAAFEKNAEDGLGGGYWVSHDGIVGRFDNRAPTDVDSRGYANLPFVPTREFLAIREGFGGNPLDVLRQVRELRDVFPPEFVKALTNFKFNTQSESAGSAGAGREQLSRSVVKEATFGESPVYEKVTATFRVYENFEHDPAFSQFTTAKVEMIVDFDYADCEITIKPRSGEVCRALIESHRFAKGALEAMIENRVGDGHSKLAAPVYLGAP